MHSGKLRQIVNVVAAVAMLTVNGLANALPINGLTTGDVADRFDVYFVPAAYAFSIWGLIYVGVIAFTVYQALPVQRDNERLQRVGYLFALTCVANAGWLVSWHYEVFWLTVVAMVTLLLLLIAIYTRLREGGRQPGWPEKVVVDLPFSLYLGWITVATVVNVTNLLDFWGWGGWGIAPQIWAVIMLVVATGISSAVGITRGDAAYVLVVVWAFVGIAVRHADVPTVSVSAWVVAAVNGVIAVVGPVLHRSTSTPRPA